MLRAAWILFLVPLCAHAQPAKDKNSEVIKELFTKKSVAIPMRDGVKLHTIIYSPKDLTQKYPMLLTRTPYGIGPYEADKFRTRLGPSPLFHKEGYIFVYQDVRGRWQSEGVFENMRPQKTERTSPKDFDESTDAYDTIDWLVKNVPGHNGKVGQYGISYPGFYTAAGMINAHPNLKASSPQAPIADWFFDDFYHHGAFFMPHAFDFFATAGLDRTKPTTEKSPPFAYPTKDGYQFYLGVGPVKNLNEKHLKNRSTFFNQILAHPNYDDFWKARNILPHLKNVAPAVMTVGGWYDAEDLYGIFHTYQAVERQNPGIFNVLVVGPWAHGGWTKDSSKLGNVAFGADSSAFYQKEAELAFFNHFLKGKGENKLPEALMFETGANKWRSFASWPPANLQKRTLFLGAHGKLTEKAPGPDGFDAFVSDPKKPVPFIENIATNMTREYMTDDQRFASKRSDVLVYQTDPLAGDVTLAGKIFAKLVVATTGTDADWIVKVIDVFPEDRKEIVNGRPMAGYQMHVRSEVMRGRFRKSYTIPEAFVANEPTRVEFPLLDVLHTFKKGHRIMVQIHSTWFPLIDRNPQKFVPNIFFADESDFQSATHTVFRSAKLTSRVEFEVLKER